MPFRHSFHTFSRSAHLSHGRECYSTVTLSVHSIALLLLSGSVTLPSLLSLQLPRIRQTRVIFVKPQQHHQMTKSNNSIRDRRKRRERHVRKIIDKLHAIMPDRHSRIRRLKRILSKSGSALSIISDLVDTHPSNSRTIPPIPRQMALPAVVPPSIAPQPTSTLPTVPQPTSTLPTAPQPTSTLPTAPQPTSTLHIYCSATHVDFTYFHQRGNQRYAARW